MDMMWGNPTSSTSSANWRDWCIIIDNARSVTRSVVSWNRRLEDTEGARRDLIPFGHFGLTINAGATKVSVVTWATSSMSGQEAKAYSNVSTDGRQAAIERHRTGAYTGDGYAGVAYAASSTLPNGRRASATPSFPIRDGKW